MAKKDDTDNETGITPKATDGEPHGDGDGDGGSVVQMSERGQRGRSVSERAEAGEAEPATEQEDDGQVAFVMEHGKRVTLSSLVKKGIPVKYAFNMNGKSVQGGKAMGLISFSDPDLMLVVPARAGKVEIDPTYNDDGEVKEVTIRVNVKPRYVYDAQSDAGRQALGLPPLGEAETG